MDLTLGGVLVPGGTSEGGAAYGGCLPVPGRIFTPKTFLARNIRGDQKRYKVHKGERFRCRQDDQRFLFQGAPCSDPARRPVTNCISSEEWIV
jgi:hypothetical protein